MAFEDGVRAGRRRRFRRAAAIVALLLAWAADSLYHESAARRALHAAGFGETITASSRRWRCPIGRATEFWAQGRTVGGETQGYVCTSHVWPAAIHETSASELDLDPFSEV